MASASCPDDVLQASDGKTRLVRLSRLLLCGGTRIMRELFDSIIPPRNLNAVLSSTAVKARLQEMRNKRLLTCIQWEILFPPTGSVLPTGSVQSTSFDITLLFKLLREKKICGLNAPCNGWDKEPNIGDISLEADMARIKFYRNEIAHAKKMELTEKDFIDYWKKIKEALVRIVRHYAKSASTVADWETAINKLLTDPLTENDKKNIDELKSWYLAEKELKQMVEQILEKGKGDGKDVRDLKQMAQQLLKKLEGFGKGKEEDSVELSRVMVHHKTVEELVFELSEDLLFFKILAQIPPEHLENAFNELPECMLRYKMFQERALRIGLDLPDRPQDSDAQFYNDQVCRVVVYIQVNMTESLNELFVLVLCFQNVIIKLKLFQALASRDFQMEANKEVLESFLNFLSESNLDVEWIEELEDIAKNYSDDDFEQKLEELIARFKRKVCDRGDRMAHNKTDKELMFELGEDISYFQTIARVKSDRSENPCNELPEFTFRYLFFQERASKIGLDLPDRPQDSNAQFYENQVYRVAIYIQVNMRDSLIELFAQVVEFQNIIIQLKLFQAIASVVSQTIANPHLESFLDSLSKSNLGGEWKEELKEIAKNCSNDDFDQKLKELIDRFKIQACDLEDKRTHHKTGKEQKSEEFTERFKRQACDLGDKMTHYKTGKEQKSEEFTERFKRKACDLGDSNSSSQIKRSEVDPTRVMITEGCWAVSLVHLPDRSNPQHAFLVIEGLEDQKSQIWFADFVAVECFDLALPGTEQGRVRIEHHHSEGIADQKLLFKCKKAKMDIDASDRLLYTTWIITKSTAKTLLNMIEAQKEKPPKFHALGQTSVSAASCVTSSSNTTGHNCFTFSRKMLLGLNDEFITLPEDSFEMWIGSATSRVISSTGERNGLGKKKKCPEKAGEEGENAQKS